MQQVEGSIPLLTSCYAVNNDTARALDSFLMTLKTVQQAANLELL